MRVVSLHNSLVFRLLFLTGLVLHNTTNSGHKKMTPVHDISKVEKFTFMYPPDQFSVPDWMDDVLKSNESKIIVRYSKTLIQNTLF